jgi:hypothetical protein
MCVVSTGLLALGALNGLVLPLSTVGQRQLTKTKVDYDKKDGEENEQENNEGKSIVLNQCVFVGFNVVFVTVLVRIFVFVWDLLCQLG